MPLVIEDGVGRTDAESYATAAELATFAASFGYTIPEAEADQEAWLRRAAQEMNGYSWRGDRALTTQALAHPRINACFRSGQYLQANTIYREIKYGQMMLAIELYGLSLKPEVQAGASGLITGEVKRVEGAVTIERTFDNTGRVMPVSPHAASRTQFSDFLTPRGLFAVRG